MIKIYYIFSDKYRKLKMIKIYCTNCKSGKKIKNLKYFIFSRKHQLFLLSVISATVSVKVYSRKKNQLN